MRRRPTRCVGPSRAPSMSTHRAKRRLEAAAACSPPRPRRATDAESTPPERIDGERPAGEEAARPRLRAARRILPLRGREACPAAVDPRSARRREAACVDEQGVAGRHAPQRRVQRLFGLEGRAGEPCGDRDGVELDVARHSLSRAARASVRASTSSPPAGVEERVQAGAVADQLQARPRPRSRRLPVLGGLLGAHPRSDVP